MNRRVISIAIGASLALAIGTGTVSAGNPAVTGQPSQSCQTFNGSGPAGIVSSTNGFATRAVVVYAGSPGTPSLANGNARAVSQYDVACYQVSIHH
jgi:hypothetical protein